jgi:tetraprenyl-beta-curcumene synthase
MVPPPAGSCPASAVELSRAAPLYWLGVFPLVRRERRRCTRRAKQIPDPALRQLALSTIEQERGNVEGASAYATLAAHKHRSDVVRALSVFQIIYDYVDTLAEQDATDPVSNGLRLHLALRLALDPAAAHPDYYAHHPQGCDGGYLRELVERCRASFGALPSPNAVRDPALLAVHRIGIFQSLNHSYHTASRDVLARWALRQTASYCGLHWWESAAATASSLTVFALIASSSHTGLQTSAAWNIYRAYYPWIGALHVLLDSLLDFEEDLAAGRHSLIQHYRSPQEAAQRIGAIAAEAARRAQALPWGMRHRMILAAMTSFYLSAAPPHSPYARLARPLVLAAMGQLARPTMLIMSARRKAAQLKPPAGAPRARA